jgi:single-strand DNA-binding protein
MASYNKTVLIGNLTREIEIKYTQGGMAICNNALAVNEKRKVGTEYVDDTLFIDITFFGKTAEIAAEYVKKGSSVLVEGRLKLEKWEKEGEKRQKISLAVDKLVMLGSKESPKERELSHVPAGNASDFGSDDDVPF